MDEEFPGLLTVRWCGLEMDAAWYRKQVMCSESATSNGCRLDHHLKKRNNANASQLWIKKTKRKPNEC